MRPSRSVSPFLDDGLRFGPVLRARRLELGMSRECVAREAHVSLQTLKKIERGATTDPGLFTARAIAQAVQWSVDDLLTRIDNRERPITPVRMAAPTGLVSIGYEGRDASGLVQELRQRSVTALVDVRLTPISRKPGLSKRALGESLAAAGIRYEHLPALGNPRDNREGFADAGDGRPRRRFEELLASPAATDAVNHLVSLAHDEAVAVLCFERAEAHCHRQVILDRVRASHPEIALQRA